MLLIRKPLLDTRDKKGSEKASDPVLYTVSQTEKRGEGKAYEMIEDDIPF